MSVISVGESPAFTAANQIYYFGIGRGRWVGEFTFRVLDWPAFWHDSIGLQNRFLTLAMVLVQSVFGRSRIDSEIEIAPSEGVFGVARNTVRIHKFHLTLYFLKEQYTLNPNGIDVQVDASERFGPVWFLFRQSKRHPARIGDAGMSSVYEMPLLGSPWRAAYTVQTDRSRIDGRLTCRWAESSETIHRS